MVLDERLETWLVRRGAARPRFVMAVIAVVSSLVLDQIVDSRDSKKSEDARQQSSRIASVITGYAR